MADLSPGVETQEQIAARLVELRAKLAARTGRDGKALTRFRENVEAIRGEITRLEGLQDG